MMPLISGTLQNSGKYQESENIPVCDYYRNEPNLAGMTVLVVRWRCPKRIGNISSEFDNWFYLNLSQVDANIGY